MNFSKHFNKPLSAAQQSLLIKNKFPQFKAIRLRQNTGKWRGLLKPTDMSQTYLVEISLSPMKHPVITVLEPKLEIAPGRTRLPHVYPGDRLCLHYPRYKQWTSSKAIADTIIPWTSLWLLYYEYWLVDGQWRGGGKHPDGSDQNVA